MDFPDGVKLIPLLLISASELEFLLPLDLLDSDLDLVDLVDDSLLSAHKGLVLLGLVQVLLLEGEDVSFLLFNQILEVLNLMDVGVDCIVEIAIHDIEVLTVSCVPVLQILKMCVLKVINVSLDLFDSIEQLVVLSEELIDLVFCPVDLLGSVKELSFFQPNLVPEDCDLVLESLDMVLLFGVVDVEPLAKHGNFLPQLVFSKLHRVQVVKQSGIFFPGVCSLALPVKVLSLEPLCVVVILVVFALVDILEFINFTLLMGDLEVQLVNLGQQPPLVLFVKGLFIPEVGHVDLALPDFSLQSTVFTGLSVN